MCGYIPIHGLSPMVWKIGNKEIWERGMWIHLFEWGKKQTNMKIFVSHVNVHQSMTSAEEHFNNQIGRVTYSVCPN